MAAENREIPALTVGDNGVPGFVSGIKQVKVINGPRTCPVSLHTGEGTAFTAVTLFLLDNNSFHARPLKSSRPRVFPE
jgi:hypothetical protein